MQIVDRITAVLNLSSRPLTAQQIAIQVDHDGQSISSALTRLHRRGLVIRSEGRSENNRHLFTYSLPQLQA